MHSVGQAGEGPQTSALLRIPAELRERAQWCITGPDKRPMTVDGRAASAIDPGTWADFDTACQSAADRGWGVGYVLTANDPFACIDMDVKDGTPPDALDRYRSIIEAFDSYTERSRSGRGWHVWVRGKIGKGRRRDGVEVYSQERFIVCTGDVVRERPVAPRQPLLDNMIGSMEPPAPDVLLTGEDVPDLALAERATADASELGRLFRGEWVGRYPSQSEADLALVKLLAPHTSSPRECWATFRLSALGAREKAGRADYMRRTLSLVAQHLANDAASVRHGAEVAHAFFAEAEAGADAPPPPPPHRTIRLLLDSDLDRQPPLRWLVKRVIPDAGIGAIYGDSGTFKSFLTLDLLAHISNGEDWFDNKVKPAPAVYIPFEGQGGIPNRVKAWRLAQTVRRNPDLLMALEPDPDIRSNIAVVMDPLNLRDAGHRDALVATLQYSGWAGGILCIDTLAHASAGLDENSSAMAEMISIFRDLQQRLGGVILLVHHSGKDTSRGMRGWSGLHAAMDFVIECQRDKDDPGLAAEFFLAKVKDGTTGGRTRFVLQQYQIGVDEDGDYISSLVVCQPPQTDFADKSDNPFRTDANDAATATEDDAFLDAWIREEVTAGRRPTGRWLEAQRVHVADRRNLTQKRLRDAVARLKGVGRIEETQGGPSGAKWLRPIDNPAEGAA